MSFDTLLRQSEDLCKKIHKECKFIEETQIRKFHDVKGTMTTINYLINIRRVFQNIVVTLDEVNAVTCKKLNLAGLSCTKQLDIEENIYKGGRPRPHTRDETSQQSDKISSPFLVVPSAKKRKKKTERSNGRESTTLSRHTFDSGSDGFIKIESKRSHAEETFKLRETGFTKTIDDRRSFEQKFITVNMGFDTMVQLQIYRNKEDIPELSFGIIKNTGLIIDSKMLYHTPRKHIIVFRLSKTGYTSCEMGRISPEDRNIRTVLCNNISSCKYGDDCNYYHLPLYYPNTNHIKFFFKTPLCPKDPSFGHGPTFKSQKSNLSFVDVGTLASYCATQLILIRLLCLHRE